jgi:tetratricopeptide (TPR) repeat protein
MVMYDRLIALKPDQPHYYEMQISLCKKTGDDDRLLIILDQYEDLIGLTESIARTRFETLDRLGRYDEASATLDALTKVYPTDIDYKFLAASYAKKRGMEDKANQYYRDILISNPENSRAKLALASAEKAQGDEAGYLASIIPVMSNPEIDIDIKLKELIPYVVTLSETKDSILGVRLTELTRFLINAHPADAKSYAIHGDVQSILGNSTKAIESYTKSTTINGSVYSVWEQLLSLLMANRSYNELIRQAELAMVNFPNQAYLYYVAGFGLYQTEDFHEAVESLNEALIMSGRNAGQKISVLNVLGLSYDALGELEKSATAFESALRIDPKSAETLSYYSLVLSARITQSEKALKMTETVLNQQGLTPEIHEILARVLYNQQQYAEAYDSMEKVLRSNPFGDDYNLAGDILNKLDRKPEAVKMWQKALENGCSDSSLKSKISAAGAQ